MRIDLEAFDDLRLVGLVHARLGYADLAELRRVVGRLLARALAHGTRTLAVLVLVDGHGKEALVERVAVDAFVVARVVAVVVGIVVAFIATSGCFLLLLVESTRRSVATAAAGVIVEKRGVHVRAGEQIGDGAVEVDTLGRHALELVVASKCAQLLPVLVRLVELRLCRVQLGVQVVFFCWFVCLFIFATMQQHQDQDQAKSKIDKNTECPIVAEKWFVALHDLGNGLVALVLVQAGLDRLGLFDHNLFDGHLCRRRRRLHRRVDRVGSLELVAIRGGVGRHLELLARRRSASSTLRVVVVDYYDRCCQ